MPSTSVYGSDLFDLVGRSFSEDELTSALFGCKAELEGSDGDELKVEIKDSNRIDLLSTEGIARTIRGYLGIETGFPKHRAKPSGIKIIVDPKVGDVRPYVVACCARDVKLSDDTLVSYMNLQEKIHLTYGRGRKRMAIGFYDLDLVVPPIRYILTPPDQNSFVPLGMEEELTPEEILKEHPKGRDYAHLLEGFDGYPMLLDSNDQVLSMPPIINSNTLGKITPQTGNLFVEATGSDFDVLSLGLNVLATSLADRGGVLQSVKLDYGSYVKTTPELTPTTTTLDPGLCNQLLGLKLNKREIVELLRKARFGARSEAGGISVTIPPYRGDIMHQTDLVEEVAIMYGYERFEPIEPRIPTIGRTDPLEDFSDALRELMLGLGFQEIMTFVLTSPENVSVRMGNRDISYVEIENPSTATHSIFRPDLLTSILEFLGHNAHVSYPQRVFEVGDSVILDERGCTTERKACLAWADSKVNLTQLKGLVDSIMNTLGLDHRYRKLEAPHFIDGRAAEIEVGGSIVGIYGEIHPAVLDSWQIPVPVLIAELLVDHIFDLTVGN
jgi:phenylalanyl-tRNA synthetase beta chain